MTTSKTIELQEKGCMTVNAPKSEEQHKRQPFDFLQRPAIIAKNNFKYKSLSNWAFNISVGCTHGCRFCYVPSAATNKQGELLALHQVTDPDEQWGQYSLLRPWDEKIFLASLRKAANTKRRKLKPDGNRAVMFCSTTDPFQVFKGSTPEVTRLLNTSSEALVTRALEAMRDKSELNVRILTRSPLAKKQFELFRSFGNRLMFGMSLPTLNDRLARVYEPNAPSPSQRLATLRAAKAAGLNVYVAVAPTYPECGEEDLRKTLIAVKGLDPLTVFHEPINIRAENVARIKAHAQELGVELKTEVFAPRESWRQYAFGSLILVQRLATEVGLENCLHLWPDQHLKSKPQFLKMRKASYQTLNPGAVLTRARKKADLATYEEYLRWINQWHGRISEWPGKPRETAWEIPSLPGEGIPGQAARIAEITA